MAKPQQQHKGPIAKAVDKVLHPGHAGEADAAAAPAPAVKPPAKSSRSGKADPARDYANHPKFAKFKGEK